MSVRTLILAILCIAGVLGNVVLATGNDSRALDLGGVPPCGLKCLTQAAISSQCSLSDTGCLCRNGDIGRAHSACMLEKCTMQDSLDTARVQASLCNWSNESKRTEFFIYSGVVYTLAVSFVALRVVGKIVSSRLAWDDAMVVGALCLTAVPLGCVLAMTRIGFGEHLWNLEDGMLLPILRFFAIAWSTYTVVLGLIKISLLMFYLEIFQSYRFRITAYSILAFIVVNTTIICLLTTFACNPVQSFWDRDLHGKCMNVTALALANSASAIIQDVVLLILPLFFIKNLNMRNNRKIAVGFMFCVGSFGCIATIIRLKILLTFKISIDPTWDYVLVTIWTELELAAIFLCVSLPSIRILVVRLLPRSFKEWFMSITHGSRSYSDPAQKQKSPQNLTPQSGWKKPSSWGFPDVTVDAEELQHNSRQQRRRNLFAGIWSRTPGSPFSSHAEGTHRLQSIASNIDDVLAASGGRGAPSPEQNESKSKAQQISVELTELSASGSKAPSSSLDRDRERDRGKGRIGSIDRDRDGSRSRSSRDDELTALPDLGCLPERSYSDLDLRKHLRSADGIV